MTILSRGALTCCLFIILFGCNVSAPVTSKSQSHEEARSVILDYANQYERIYLKYQGDDLYDRLSKLEDEYHQGLSRLEEQGKWTPSKETGTTIKLSFLIGQFQGAVESCKVEQESRDKTRMACNQAHKLKKKMVELLSR